MVYWNLVAVPGNCRLTSRITFPSVTSSRGLRLSERDCKAVTRCILETLCLRVEDALMHDMELGTMNAMTGP